MEDSTYALLDYTTLVEPLHFALEIVVALLHSLELVAVAVQELFKEYYTSEHANHPKTTKCDKKFWTKDLHPEYP
jgi:hypothetical protein